MRNLDEWMAQSNAAGKTIDDISARESLRWEQISATRNGARFTPQGDPQYDSILTDKDVAYDSLAECNEAFQRLKGEGQSQVVITAGGVTTHVTD